MSAPDTSTVRKLRTLLEHHDQAAHAIRMTLGLLNGHDGRTKPGGALATDTEAASTPPAPAPQKRRRSRMSPAARRAVSIRMKRYWADRRKAKGR